VYWARFWSIQRILLLLAEALLFNSQEIGWCLYHSTIFIFVGILADWVMFHIFTLETKWFHGYIVDSRVCGMDLWGLISRKQDNESDEQMVSSGRTSQSSITSVFNGLELTDMAASTISDVRIELGKKGAVPLIDFSRLVIKLRCMLGSGSSARVYEGKWCDRRCAVKILFTVEITPEEIRRTCIEASLLHRLQASSEHVVGLYGVAILPPCLSVVLELCSEGSLNDILYSKVTSVDCDELLTSELRSQTYSTSGRAVPKYHFVKEFTWAQWLELALGACRGVAAVAGMLPGLSHNDIKSANFLVHCPQNMQSTSAQSSNTITVKTKRSSTLTSESIQLETPLVYIAKISDLEFASQGKTPEHYMRGDTPNWAAPEVLSGSEPVSPASDVYALGGVLYEILARCVPFDGDSAAVVAAQIRADRKLPLPDVPWTTLVHEQNAAAEVSPFEVVNIDTIRFSTWFSSAPMSARLEAKSRARVAQAMFRARAYKPAERPTASELANELASLREDFLKAVTEVKMEARRSSFSSALVGGLGSRTSPGEK
jgi:serine/threonine protein kinase